MSKISSIRQSTAVRHSSSGTKEFAAAAKKAQLVPTKAAPQQSQTAKNPITIDQPKPLTKDIGNSQGTGGNDTLNGNLNNNEIRGNGGNDIINGGGGNDRLYGDAGNDTISGGGVWDNNGPIRYPQPWGNNYMSGGEGDDLIYGQAAPSIFPNPQPDGNDRISGGSGHDTVAYYGNASDFTVLREGNTYKVVDNRTGKTDTLSGIEDVKFGKPTASLDGIESWQTFRIQDLEPRDNAPLDRAS